MAERRVIDCVILKKKAKPFDYFFFLFFGRYLLCLFCLGKESSH